MDQLDLFGNPISNKPADIKKVDKQEKKVVPTVDEKSQKIEHPQSTAPTIEVDPTPKFDTTEVEEPIAPAHKVDEKQLEKVYYTITEVAKMFDVNASLLRFWEKEFKQLGRIKKNKKGDRYYNKENIRHLNIIYYLLRERRMTIAGARDSLKNNRKSTAAQFDLVKNLQQIRNFLEDLKTAIHVEN